MFSYTDLLDLHDTNRDGVLTKQEIRAIMSKYYDDTDLETTVNENMNFCILIFINVLFVFSGFKQRWSDIKR